MTDDKRFYWIRLKTDFFDLPAIDYMLEQDHGCEYVVLYLKLCLLTSNSGGELSRKIGEMIIPYEPKKIADVTRFDIDTVRVALELYKSLGLIFQQQNGMYVIAELGTMVGSETKWAEKKRLQRGQKEDIVPALPAGNAANSPPGGDIVPDLNPASEDDVRQEKELELEKELDKKREKQRSTPAPTKKTYGEMQNVKLTDEEHQKLLALYGRQVAGKIDELSLYIASQGKRYSSHYATLRKWFQRDGVPQVSQQKRRDDGWL